jgi:hypothetical protein
MYVLRADGHKGTESMPRVELTDRFVSSAKAGDFFDAKTPGLNLRVTPNGLKSWFAMFTSPKDGKRARVTLGRYPQTPLARARRLALEARGCAEEGKDPRDLLGAQIASKSSVSGLIESYLAKHVRPALRSAQAIERRLTKNVIPIIGNVALTDLHKREINRVLDPVIERDAPIEAARCFEDMRAIFRWAVSRGDLDHSPMEGMRKPATSAPRDRVLTDDEVKKLWQVLPTALPRSTACQQLIKLCLLTAQRVGEVCGTHCPVMQSRIPSDSRKLVSDWRNGPCTTCDGPQSRAWPRSALNLSCSAMLSGIVALPRQE